MMSKVSHRLGKDCITSALRNLLTSYSLNLTEAIVFGIGEGAYFWNCWLEGAPFPVFVTQNPRLEYHFSTNVGMNLSLVEPKDTFDLEVPLDRVRSGIPVMVKADPYYLDYAWSGTSAKRTHFGEHVLLIVEVKGDRALISDIWQETLVEVSLIDLLRARTTLEGEPYLLPRGRWYEVQRPAEWPDLIKASRVAILNMADQNLNSRGDVGIEGLKKASLLFPEMLSRWTEERNPMRNLWLNVLIMRMDEGGLCTGFRSFLFEFLREYCEFTEDGVLLKTISDLGPSIEEGWRTFLSLLKNECLQENFHRPKENLWKEASRSIAQLAELESQLWIHLAKI